MPNRHPDSPDPGRSQHSDRLPSKGGPRPSAAPDGERRFGFARRWEAHKAQRSHRRMWLIMGLDAALLVLILIMVRMLLKKLGG